MLRDTALCDVYSKTESWHQNTEVWLFWKHSEMCKWDLQFLGSEEMALFLRLCFSVIPLHLDSLTNIFSA